MYPKWFVLGTLECTTFSVDFIFADPKVILPGSFFIQISIWIIRFGGTLKLAFSPGKFGPQGAVGIIGFVQPIDHVIFIGPRGFCGSIYIVFNPNSFSFTVYIITFYDYRIWQ